MRCEKIIMVVAGSLMMLVLPVTASALFTQDFSDSTVVADYVDATEPTKNQFSLLAANSMSIESGRLKMESAAGGAGHFRRWIPMEGTPVSAMSFTFDLEMSDFSESNNTRLIGGTIGEPGGGNHWMSWGIDATGVGNEWKMAGSAQAFTGVQTISLKLNASDVEMDYIDPLGGTQTLAASSYDIWVGTTLVVDGRSGSSWINDSKELSAFTITLGQPVAATYYFDNVNITAIPEPANFGLFTLLSSGLLLTFCRKRRRTC